jgi:hypothetical protein
VDVISKNIFVLFGHNVEYKMKCGKSFKLLCILIIYFDHLIVLDSQKYTYFSKNAWFSKIEFGFGDKNLYVGIEKVLSIMSYNAILYKNDLHH